MQTEISQTWEQALPHRSAEVRAVVAARLAPHVTPELTALVLSDHGDALFAAAAQAPPLDEEWTRPWGGVIGALLLIAEVHAHAASVIERAAVLRSHLGAVAVQDRSLVDVADQLGVTRQALHKAITRDPASSPATTLVPTLTLGGQL